MNVVYDVDPFRLKEMRLANVPIKEIAKTLGVTYNAVWQRCRTLGLPMPERQYRTHCDKGHELAVVGTVLISKGRLKNPVAKCKPCYEARKEAENARRRAANRGSVCEMGHDQARYASPTGCRKCRSEQSKAMHAAAGRGNRTPFQPRPALTWEDYADAVDKDFALPHWEKRAPLIKQWLINRGVKPS